MNIGIRVNPATGQFMRAGLPGGSAGKQISGLAAAGKKTEDVSSQLFSPSLRMRMAEMNAAQSTLPQAKREVVFDAASGTTFDAQRMSRSTSSAQKKMKKLQYNFKLISSQIMRAKTSSSASQAVSSAKRMVAQLRRKRKSGEYDDEELEAAIAHAQAMERVAKKHVKYLQQEEQAARSGQICEEKLPKEEQELTESAPTEDLSGMTDEFSKDPAEISKEFSEQMEQVQQELAESLAEIPEEFAEEMAQLMQEYADMMSETMEDLGGDLLESLSGFDTDIDPEDLKALKQKHRAKEMQEIAKADAKYLKAIFEKYAADRRQAASGVSQVMGTMNRMSGMGGVISVSSMPQTASVSSMPQTASVSAPATASASVPTEGSSVDVSV
ncbi:MAG: hypothetical protein MSA09_01885 [Lachnospiraceae bacterium]|nr:hypothetical protein [Lachnospiraceae bacterium]